MFETPTSPTPGPAIATESRFALAANEGAAGRVRRQVDAVIANVERAWRDGGVVYRASKAERTHTDAVPESSMRSRAAEFGVLLNAVQGRVASTGPEIVALAQLVLDIVAPSQAVLPSLRPAGNGSWLSRLVGGVLRPHQMVEHNAGRVLFAENSAQMMRLSLQAVIAAGMPARHCRPGAAVAGDSLLRAQALCDAAILWVCNPWEFDADERSAAALSIARLMENSAVDANTAAGMRLALMGMPLIGLTFVRLCLLASGDSANSADRTFEARTWPSTPTPPSVARPHWAQRTARA